MKEMGPKFTVNWSSIFSWNATNPYIFPVLVQNEGPKTPQRVMWERVPCLNPATACVPAFKPARETWTDQLAAARMQIHLSATQFSKNSDANRPRQQYNCGSSISCRDMVRSPRAAAVSTPVCRCENVARTAHRLAELTFKLASTRSREVNPASSSKPAIKQNVFAESPGRGARG